MVVLLTADNSPLLRLRVVFALEQTAAQNLTLLSARRPQKYEDHPAKHTPGPWEAKRETDYVPAQVWAEGRQIAEVYGESREARAANARLIAAAPELLNALRDIIAECWAEYEYADRALKQSPTVKEIRKAEHVIRKAKGQSTTNVLSEFNRLCQMRDLAAYRAVAAIQIVVDSFEAQDYQTAFTQLQKARTEFQEGEQLCSWLIRKPPGNF